ncbi:MAG: hypothetical protein AAFN65_03670 [Bacteroidota bacterium]
MTNSRTAIPISDKRDIQSGIVKSNGKDYSNYIFIRVENIRETITIIKYITQSIQSHYSQERRTKQYRISKHNRFIKNNNLYKKLKNNFNINIGLSPCAIREISPTDENNPDDFSFQSGFNDNFQIRLSGFYEILKTASPIDQLLYYDNFSDPDFERYHIYISIHCDSKKRLKNKTITILNKVKHLTKNNIFIRLQTGFTLRRGKKQIEHFGFADGLSESTPMISKYKQTFIESRSKITNNGTYLFFLKLEQDLDAFNKHLLDFQNLLKINKVNNVDTKKIKSLILGRTPEGIPLLTKKDSKRLSQNINYFDFSNDPLGETCPFHAHIRALNNRTKKDSILEIAFS